MAFLKSVSLSILILFLVVNCSEKKESNPLSAKNSPPTLEIIGFAEDSLTYIENNKYLFQFKASDPDNNPLTVTAKSQDSSGTIEMLGDNEGIYKGHYTPLRKGEHIIEIRVSDKIAQVSKNLTVFFFENFLPVPVIKFKEINRNAADTLFTYEFDASESSDQDGSISRVIWDLDGRTVADLVTNKVTHNFDYYGLYKIKLTVYDEHDAWGSTSTLINNSLPQLTISADQTGGDFPLTVNFIAVASNYDNSPVSFEWDFRDGSKSNLQSPTYTFNQEGEYAVVCAASDRIGTVKDSIRINSSDQPPVAKFNISPATTVKNSDQLIFNASESYDNNGIKQYHWFIKMPDGQTNQLGAVEGEIFNYTVHTEVGNNNTGLVVEDFTSNFSDTSWVQLVVENRLPEAKFQAQTTSFKIEIIDNSSSDPDPYDVLSYNWYINDTEIAEALNQSLPEFTFSDEGNYDVKLRVTDSNAAFDELQTTLFVPGKPAAILTSVDQTTNKEALTLDGSQSTGPGNLRLAKYYFYLLDNDQILLNANSTDDAIFVYQDKLSVGTHQFGLVVEDENSIQSDMTTKTVDYLNSPPDVDFTYAKDAEQVIVTTNATSDIDPGDQITFTWYVDAVHLPQFDDEPTPTFDLQAGLHEIKLRATDNHNDFSEKSENVDVPGKPIADFVFPGNTNSYTAYNQNVITLDASNSDGGHLGGGIDKYSWFVKYPSNDTVAVGDSTLSVYTITTGYPVGLNQIGLKITNNAGYESDFVWKNLTIENTKPTLGFKMNGLDPSCCTIRVFVPDTVYCTNATYDPDPFDVITYEWTVGFEGTTVMTSDLQDIAVAITNRGFYDINLKVYENGIYVGTSPFTGYVEGL